MICNHLCVLCKKKTEDVYKKAARLINEFIQGEGYNVNVQKSLLFVAFSDQKF